MVTIDDIKTHYKLDKLDNTSDANKPATAAMSNSLASKLTKTTFDTVNAMPGLPIWDVGMAFLPSLTECEIDANGKISKFTDAAGGVQLVQTDAARQPELKIDTLGREYIRFDQASMFVDNLDISRLGGSTSKTTSFMFVANVDSAVSQSNFCWYEGVPGSLNSDNRFQAHLPWSNSNAYIDYGTAQGSGRLVANGLQNATGRIVSFYYERNGAVGTLWQNGVQLVRRTDLSSTISSGAKGTFCLGASPESLTLHTKMDFYAMFIYPRALTDEEKARMFLYTKKHFKQLPSGAS